MNNKNINISEKITLLTKSTLEIKQILKVFYETADALPEEEAFAINNIIMVLDKEAAVLKMKLNKQTHK